MFKNMTPKQLLRLAPLIIMAFFLPNIVLMQSIEKYDLENILLGYSQGYEFFAQAKSYFLFIITMLIILVSIAYRLLFKENLFTRLTWLYAPILVYFIFVYGSTYYGSPVPLMSKHFIGYDFTEYIYTRGISIWGVMDRFEGFYALMCYITILIYSINVVRSREDFELIFKSIIGGAIINSLIGVGQFFGYDFFRSQLGQYLIVPNNLAKFRGSLTFKFDEGVIYSTLYNPNYVGSYMALVIPLTLYFLINRKGMWKGLYGFFFVLFLINLFGSNSSAGLIGVVFAGIAIGSVHFKTTLKHHKQALLIIFLFIGVFTTLNFVVKESLSKQFVGSVENTQTTTDHFSLQDIILTDNQAEIITSKYHFSLRLEDTSEIISISLFDEKDQLVETISPLVNGEVFRFQDQTICPFSFTYDINFHTLGVLNGERRFFLAWYDGEALGATSANEIVAIHDFQRFKPLDAYQSFATQRGFIWSRTIPLLKSTFFIGTGPDTFGLIFPQNDIIGKFNAYGDGAIFVDKPHNFYLQVAINTGVMSLIALLVLFLGYLIKSIKYEKTQILSPINIAVFASIVGYLVTGLANDSIVGIAPIFWLILGSGISLFTLEKKASVAVADGLLLNREGEPIVVQ